MSVSPGMQTAVNVSGSIATYYSPSNPAIGSISNTVTVKLDPALGLPSGSNTLGSIGVFFSPVHYSVYYFRETA